MVVVRWFPASWLLIERRGKVLYVDPAYLRSYFDSYPPRVDYSRWPGPIDGLPEADLPQADAVLITHKHKDHCKAVTVRRLSGDGTKVFAPGSAAEELGDDFTRVDEGDEFDACGFEVVAVPAYNTPEGHSTRKQHKRGTGVGYLLKAGGISLYHAGDTDLIPEMGDLPSVDAAFLPVGGTFTMDADEAADAVALMRPQVAVPMHYRDPQHAEAFAKAVEARSGQCRLLQIGESVDL